MPILITVEGTDGSGKQTQCNKLYEYFKSLGFKVKLLSFPMYDNDSSHFVKSYLTGKYGDLETTKINEYSGSMIFAIDRLISYITDWGNDYKDYDFIIADRYVESNLIHQGAKIESLSDLVRYVDWEQDFEYNKLRLPKPDITLFLNMPPEASELLRKNRKNKITNSDIQDIHESNHAYQLSSYTTSYTMCDLCGWKRINCTYNDNYVKSIDDILSVDAISSECISVILKNQKVKRLLKKHNII